MGGICSCFHVADEQDNGASTSDNCFCPGCLLHKFTNNHVNIILRRQRYTITSPNQNTHSSILGLLNNVSAVSSRCGAEVRLGSSRLASGTHHSQVQPERQSDVRVDRKTGQGLRIHLTPNDGEFEDQKSATSSPNAFSHDEDECPTCLEEYIPENPKIMAKCSHHFHLSCIYEWKERSENCPVCEQLMQFDESAEQR